MSKTEVKQMIADALKEMQGAAPAAPAAPVTSKTASKKWARASKQAEKPAKKQRPDNRKDITTIGYLPDGKPVTLGFDETYNFGVGADGTMIYHGERKWRLLAKIAPMVVAAIDANS